MQTKDKMIELKEDMNVVVSNKEELYHLETLLFKNDIGWYNSGKKHINNMYEGYDADTKYNIFIDTDKTITHSGFKVGAYRSEKLYNYKEFMTKFRGETPNDKPKILSNSLFKRVKPSLRQD